MRNIITAREVNADAYGQTGAILPRVPDRPERDAGLYPGRIQRQDRAQLCFTPDGKSWRSRAHRRTNGRAVAPDGVTQERVVRELARIAFVDPTQAIDFECAGLREDAKADDRAALMSVRVKSGDDFTEREVRLYDKVRALELLGKHLGMFTEKVELSGERVRIVDDVPEAARDG